jgi:uncharacterized protein
MGKWQQLATQVLEAAKVPLTPDEIWNYASQKGMATANVGKTPAASIGAMLYTHIKEAGAKAEFQKIGKKPVRFVLSKIALDNIPNSNSYPAQPVIATGTSAMPQDTKQKAASALSSTEPVSGASTSIPGLEKVKAIERDLHPDLAAYVDLEPHFSARVRTIFHESSKKAPKGVNEWLHPDMVGVYFPFGKYGKETLSLQKELAVNAVKFFSFELKLKLDFSNLRECFFQAVSNSSWANEGYLVAWQIADDAKLKDELRRLSNAFGIGVIRLNCLSVKGSEILFPATSRTHLDWSTVDRLAAENGKMRKLLDHVTGSVKSGHVVGENDYDEVFSPDKMKRHALDKHLC